MGEATAIIAGSGALPALLAQRLADDGAPFVIAQLDGFEMDNPGGWLVERFVLERLALLFGRLHAQGVGRLVFAGAVRRPAIDPELIDPQTATYLARLLPAFREGDDALLRAVIGLCEDEGFAVAGAADILPELLPGEGVPTRAQPGDADRDDAARAAEIVAALGAADVGQGAVVAQGQCLALETLPGTNAMLAWVAEVAGAWRPDPHGAKGVLLKAAKPGQDRRADLPAVGPDTVAAAAGAGLAGIVVEAGGVMLLDAAATVAEADARGLFLWVRGG